MRRPLALALALALGLVGGLTCSSSTPSGAVLGNGSGRLDARFETGTARSATAGALAIDSEDRVYATGVSQGTWWDRELGVARHLMPEGYRDGDWSGDGRLTHRLGIVGDSSLEVHDSVVDASDRVLVAGYLGSDMLVVRFDTAGNLDTTFGGGDGIVTVDYGGFEVAFGIALDGANIVLAGRTWPYGMATTADAAVVRLEADGDLDPTFDTDGKVAFGGAGSQWVNAVAVDSGELLLAGEETGGWYLARLDSAGTFDAGFGTAGELHFGAGEGWTDGEAAAVVLSGTDALIAGNALVGLRDAVVVRMNAATGALVTTFDGPSGTGNGVLRFNAASLPSINSNEEARSIAIDGSKIVVGGATHFWADSGFVAKFDLATGAADTNFWDGWAAPGVVSVNWLGVVRDIVVDAGDDAYVVLGQNAADYRLTLLDDDNGTPVDWFGQPQPPTGVSAVAGSGAATVTWTPPVDNMGPTVTGYKIVVRDNSNPAYEVTAGGSPAVVTGLTNGVEYNFAVRATNWTGTSTESSPSSGVTPAAPPPPTTTTTTFAPPPPTATPPPTAPPAAPAPKPKQGVVSPGGPVTVRDGKMVPIPHATPAGVKIVAAAQTPSQNGSWTVSPTGAVYAYGDAPNLGSMGAAPLNKPVNGMTVTPSGNGYWLVASDGGLFAFGDAAFYGSVGGAGVGSDIAGMISSATGRGYTLVTADGRLFPFGDA